MRKTQILNLDLKVKLSKEYLDNGGYEKIWDIGLLDDLMLVKSQPDGKVDPNTVSPRVNAFMLAILASQLSPPFYSSFVTVSINFFKANSWDFSILS